MINRIVQDILAILLFYQILRFWGQKNCLFLFQGTLGIEQLLLWNTLSPVLRGGSSGSSMDSFLESNPLLTSNPLSELGVVRYYL